MDFQIFKDHLEKKLSEKAMFELQEFHFLPYSFGSGLLAYRINGCNYRLIYDGRENQIVIEHSGHHEKYFGCKWTKVTGLENLNDNTIGKIFELLIDRSEIDSK